MKRRVVIYCPDRHIVYDGDTPYKVGVGGGITSRVRMARALSSLGHEVTMVANCPSAGLIKNVTYVPLDQVQSIDADVLVLNTSGGALDLSPVQDLHVQAGLTILMISGVSKPHGLAGLRYDWIYAKSNFLRTTVRHIWGMEEARIFVAHNGYDREVYTQAESRKPSRDPFRVVHISHPAKGIETSTTVVRRLRAIDKRYHLWVFGGEDLWGQPRIVSAVSPGVTYFGTVGQEELAFQLMRCGISLCLHAIPEGFGNAVIESQRAGCIVLASAVGAQSELVSQGWDGILVMGDHREESVRASVVESIRHVASDDSWANSMRSNAVRAPFDSKAIARVWSAHWDLEMGAGQTGISTGAECKECGAVTVKLEDGNHCMDCGGFQLEKGSSRS